MVIRSIRPNVSSIAIENTIFIEALIKIVFTLARDELEPGNALLHVVIVELALENAVGEVLDNELHVEVNLMFRVLHKVVQINGAKLAPSLERETFDVQGFIF